MDAGDLTRRLRQFRSVAGVEGPHGIGFDAGQAHLGATVQARQGFEQTGAIFHSHLRIAVSVWGLLRECSVSDDGSMLGAREDNALILLPLRSYYRAFIS